MQRNHDADARRVGRLPRAKKNLATLDRCEYDGEQILRVSTFTLLECTRVAFFLCVGLRASAVELGWKGGSTEEIVTQNRWCGGGWGGVMCVCCIPAAGRLVHRVQGVSVLAAVAGVACCLCFWCCFVSHYAFVLGPLGGRRTNGKQRHRATAVSGGGSSSKNGAPA